MLRYGMATGPSVCSTTIVFRWRPLWSLQQLQPHHGIALGSHRDRRPLHREPRVVAGHGQDTLRRGFVEDISGSGADLHVEWLANRPSSTEAAIPPNRLYLIAKEDFIVPQSPASILVGISPIHRNRHVFTTVERMIAPVSIMFGMNGQGHT
jgi:hypothetical protein